MSKMLVALMVMAAATGTVATSLIWTLLTNPAAMASALADGRLQVILATLLGTH